MLNNDTMFAAVWQNLASNIVTSELGQPQLCVTWWQLPVIGSLIALWHTAMRQPTAYCYGLNFKEKTKKREM